MRALLARRHHAAMTTKTQPPTGTLILAENLSKSYKVGQTTIDVLYDVTFPVSAGETCAIMGPSGSGKSTLLYCLAGLESPTAGGVTLLGRQLSGRTRKELAELRRRELGFVFQSYNLMPTLSVFENVALPFRLRGERPDRNAIEAVLEAVGLGGRSAAMPPSMSGGEQQRVAISRVLAQRPQIVFADEPTGALDSHSGKMVLNELQRIGSQPGQCVLIVTHDPTVAATCDRVVFMRDGRLIDQLIRPSTEAVAAHLAALETRGAGALTQPPAEEAAAAVA